LKSKNNIFKPNLITLSSSHNSLLLVNATALNNTIYFIDPISMSIFN